MHACIGTCVYHSLDTVIMHVQFLARGLMPAYFTVSFLNDSFYIGHVADIIRMRKELGNDELPLQAMLQKWCVQY